MTWDIGQPILNESDYQEAFDLLVDLYLSRSLNSDDAEALQKIEGMVSSIKESIEEYRPPKQKWE